MDWFTIVAQIVNFLILVALLKHFLYGPIIKAMDKREETIRNRLQKADEKNRQAEEKVSEYREKQDDLESKREDLLREAREQAEQERKDKVRGAREDVDELSRRWRDSVEREKQEFLQDVRQQIGRQAVAVAGKMLSDLADAPLDQQVVAAFVHRLANMEEEQRQALADALHKDGAVQVRTAFEADDETRRRITEAVHQHIDEQADIDFTQDDTLICGVELAVSGSKVAWTVSNYLDEARHAIEQALSQGATNEQAESQDGEDGQSDGQAEEKPEASEQRSENDDKEEEHAENSGA